MKKKLIASLIAASMLLTLSACGGKDPAPDSQPTGTTPTEQASEPATGQPDAPDVSESGNANKATETGVYLYDGTFLETGKTVKLNDSGASIDMPSVTVDSAKAKLQSDGTYDIKEKTTFVMDGTSPVTDGLLNLSSTAPHEYGSASSRNGLLGAIFYNDTDERTGTSRMGAETGPVVYMQFAFHDGFPDNDTDRNKASLEINGNPAFSLDTGRTLESLMDIYGEPAGAYCKQHPGYDRPASLCYIWKSGNYPDKTLIMVYEIQYSWSNKQTVVEERNGDTDRYRLLSFFIAEEVKNWEADHNGTPIDVLPALAELGLYSD